MKRRTLLQHTSAVGLLGLLTACGGGSDPVPQPPKGKKTTFLVYLVASDLLNGKGAERDLSNMLRARNSDQVEVVLQIGGGKAPGQFPNVNMQQTRRYRLVPVAGTAQGWTLQALPEAQQPPQVAMNKPQTLQDFIQWGAREFAAEQYALCLWDHGGGPIHGFGNDYALGNGTALTLAEITSALQGSGVHFELAGFDSCLMASLEVAYNLAPLSHYLVGSEEVTFGWDWKEVVDYVATHPQTKGDALGRAIVDSYKDFDSIPRLDYTAYSVSALDRLGPLMQVFDQVASTLTSAIDTQGLQAWWAIAVARREAQDFQSNLFQTYFDLVDVKSWVKELDDVGLLPPALVNQFNAAFEALVIHVDGSEDDAGGLMMYFPRFSTLDARLLEKYRKVPFSAAYHALVDRFTAFAASSEMPYVAVGVPRLQGDTVLAEVRVVARPTQSGASKRALPILARPFDQGFGALVDERGMALSLRSGMAQGQEVRLDDCRRWPTVQGQLVTLIREDEEDEEDEELLQIPAAQPDRSGRFEEGMLLALRGDDGVLRIRWFISGSFIAGSTAAMLELEPGSLFVPLHLELRTGEWEPGNTLLRVPEGDWVVSMQAPRQAGLELRMVVSDLTGTLHSSPTGLPL